MSKLTKIQAMTLAQNQYVASMSMLLRFGIKDVEVQEHARQLVHTCTWACFSDGMIDEELRDYIINEFSIKKDVKSKN